MHQQVHTEKGFTLQIFKLLQFTTWSQFLSLSFLFLSFCLCFLGRKYVPPASPPDSPQGPGVRHLLRQTGDLTLSLKTASPRKVFSSKKVPAFSLEQLWTASVPVSLCTHISLKRYTNVLSGGLRNEPKIHLTTESMRLFTHPADNILIHLEVCFCPNPVFFLFYSTCNPKSIASHYPTLFSS